MRLEVAFFRTTAGREPVREWLQSLPKRDRRTIGLDLKTVQFGWPLGMPLVRKLESGIWEVRSSLNQRIARVLFTTIGDRMVLLHGFIKKAQKTPAGDIELARSRKADLEH
jgi:phage-related protein